MKPGIFGASAFAVIVLGSVSLGLAADEASKAKSSDGAGSAKAATASDKPAKAQPKAARLTKPWKDLNSLSEEQKKQIADIHKKAVQDKNVIEQRENADIMALLSDSQKAELKAMLDKEAADKKAKAGTKSAPKGGAGGAAGEKSAKEPGNDSARGVSASEPAGDKAKASGKEDRSESAKQPS